MTPQEWHSDPKAICPVCTFERGHHYNAFCPTPGRFPPTYDYSQTLKDAIPVAGPDGPRGRYGVPIIYHPDGSWGYMPVPIFTKTVSCNAVKDNVKGVINDHVCPTCKNDRCTKSEISCWKCGEKL